MNKYLPRLLSTSIQEALKHFPSLVLVGARQVGKSTLIKHLFPDYAYVLFDPYEDVENARKDPDLFLSNRRAPLILDEVQYAPEVISAIKRRIDQDRTPGQYILTGSQQWGVMKQMAESLTGRTLVLQLEPFSLHELTQNPSPWIQKWLENPETFLSKTAQTLPLTKTPYEHLWRGFLPEAQEIPLNLVPSFHDSYQKTYIERDIRLLADIPNLHDFTRFIRLVAALTAQEINYQQIGRELGIANETAKRWLQLLKEIFEWIEIPAFSMNSIKRLSTKPKGYFTDTGQVCFSQAITTPHAIASHPLQGALFETAVVNEIRKQLLFLNTPCNLYHYRSHGGAECDLILEQNGTYYPIEIKAKSRPSKADTRGIQAFRKQYTELNVAKGLVLCLTETPYPLTETELALPWNFSA